ncbi:glycosyltransferase family 8 protein [Candidatus Saccharibacteria bacterium]|nr:glycosyltransferase family 8 protein [Candidatus Saccharibacteria bacterium]
MSIFNTGINLLNGNKVVPIFLTISNDYAQYAAASINSLMKHANPNRNYRVIIMYDRLSLPNRWRLRNLVTKNCAIEFRKMKFNLHLQIIRTYCATKTGTGDFFSKTVYYYRAFIARLFPQYEKAVYIDSDTIILDDIGKLFDIDLGDKVMAARIDPKVTNVPEFKGYVENALDIPAKEYVNSGVLVMDLKKLRKLHYITRMTDLMKDYDVSLVAPDQDYLNLILRGKIMPLDDSWNLEPTKELPKDAKLLHFNLFNKPWHYSNVACERYFWNAAKGTGFYGDLMRTKKGFTEEMQKKDHEKVAALITKAGELAKVKKPIIKFEDK